VIGPGVSPDVMWGEAPARGSYRESADRAANAAQLRLFAGDRLCKSN
jgi:hypothetical protein